MSTGDRRRSYVREVMRHAEESSIQKAKNEVQARDERLRKRRKKEAAERIGDAVSAPSVCRYCGGRVIRCENKEVYGTNIGKWPWIYLCTKCRAYVGNHRDTDIPLGTLANEATREARKASKKEFFRLQEVLGISRGEAYKLLARHLNISHRKCHFGMFDVDGCVDASRAIYEIAGIYGVQERLYDERADLDDFVTDLQFGNFGD